MRIVLALLLSLACASAAAEPASAQSVERLLELTNAQRLMQAVQAQQRATMDTMVAGLARERGVSPEQLAQAQAAAHKAYDATTKELGWETLKPLLVQVYTETFTEDEIRGVIAFYESPAGRAYVEKTPQATARIMQLIRERVGPIMQRLQKQVREEAAHPSTPEPPAR